MLGQLTLELDQVARFYGSRLVFKQASLTCPPGSITLLVGPNGCGKSTLLRIISGMLRPSAGQVRFLDRDKKEVTPRLGLLGHGTFLYPGLTASENLEFWSRIYDRPYSDEDIRSTLQQVGLARFAQEKAGTFSRGMAQRLSLARLLLQRPEVLLLDEPETGLDQDSKQLLRLEIQRAAGSGTVVVWVTHNPVEYFSLARHTYRLERTGLSPVDGPPSEAPGQEERLPHLFPGDDTCKSRFLVDKTLKTPSYRAAEAGNRGVGKNGMLGKAWALARKDLRLTAARGTGLVQAFLLGLLLIFLFSLSLAPGQRMSGEAAAAIFWMASAFCQVLIFSSLYSLEESDDQRQGLLLCPTPMQYVWIGKAVAGLALLLAAQCVFFPASVVFLGQDLGPGWLEALWGLMAADLGMVVLGSLLGALSQGRTGRESLLTILLFPLLIPALLAGMRLMAHGFGSDFVLDVGVWTGLGLAFDAIFLAASLVLFPYLYTMEE